MTQTQEIARRLENELSKANTDETTWETVAWFWSIDVDLPQTFLGWCLDRIQLLEARMYRQHGWAR